MSEGYEGNRGRLAVRGGRAIGPQVVSSDSYVVKSQGAQPCAVSRLSLAVSRLSFAANR